MILSYTKIKLSNEIVYMWYVHLDYIYVCIYMYILTKLTIYIYVEWEYIYIKQAWLIIMQINKYKKIILQLDHYVPPSRLLFHTSSRHRPSYNSHYISRYFRQYINHYIRQYISHYISYYPYKIILSIIILLGNSKPRSYNEKTS